MARANRSAYSFLGVSVVTAVLVAACGGGDDQGVTNTAATGGIVGIAGGSAVGGKTATGGSGAKPTGGAATTGGSSAKATGGAPATGGSSAKATGGATSTAATGGAPATGGTSAASTAGAPATGGTTTASTAGAPATGGTSATSTAGASATGGTSATSTAGAPATGGTSSASTAGAPATGGSSTAGGGASATGGRSATGGTSAAAAGGTSVAATGGSSAAATGGAPATGGSSAAATGGFYAGTGGATSLTACAADTTGINDVGYCRPTTSSVNVTGQAVTLNHITFTPNGTSITITNQTGFTITSGTEITGVSPFLANDASCGTVNNIPHGVDAEVAGSGTPGTPYVGLSLTVNNSGPTPMLIALIIDDRTTNGLFVERMYSIGPVANDSVNHNYTLTWTSSAFADSCSFGTGAFQPDTILGLGFGVLYSGAATTLNLTISNITFTTT